MNNGDPWLDWVILFSSIFVLLIAGGWFVTWLVDRRRR